MVCNWPAVCSQLISLGEPLWFCWLGIILKFLPKEATSPAHWYHYTDSPLNHSVLLSKEVCSSCLASPSCSQLHTAPWSSLNSCTTPASPACWNSLLFQQFLVSAINNTLWVGERVRILWAFSLWVDSFLNETLILDKFYPGRQSFLTKQEERQQEERRSSSCSSSWPNTTFLQGWKDIVQLLHFFLLPRSFKQVLCSYSLNWHHLMVSQIVKQFLNPLFWWMRQFCLYVIQRSHMRLN